MSDRLGDFRSKSSLLENLSDAQIVDAFEQSSKNTGFGGESAVITVGSSKFFCKRLYLTPLEMLPKNKFSTKNIFDLPLHYQYGVGSAGFGVWRELESHKIASKWVEEGRCPNFPLLYHSRVIEHAARSINDEDRAKLAKDISYWEDSPEITKRLQGLHAASASIYLFIECYPTRLIDWVDSKLKSDESIDGLESELNKVNDFIASQGFLHFDAHFHNLLATDNGMVIFSDFGLAISRDFSLSEEERKFFDIHKDYDAASLRVNLMHSLVSSIFGNDSWPNVLYDDALFSKLEDKVGDIASRLGPISKVMDAFYTDMQLKSKKTPYPEAAIQKELKEIRVRL